MKRFEQTKAFSKPFKPLIAAALILAVFAPAVAGQGIHLKSGTITSGGSDHLAVQPASGTDLDSREHFIVQFESSVTEQERESLEGVNLLGYVPDNAWYASASTEDIEKLQSSDKVQKLVDLEASHKLSDSVDEDASVVEVDVFEDVENSKAEEILQRHGDSVSHVSDNTWRVESPSVSELAGEDAVKWIDTLPPEAESHIEDSRSLINVDPVQRDYDLTGEGMTAAVWDGGLAGNHRDLTYDGKRIVGDDASISDHATHVAGVLLGGGVLDSSMKGVAPDAQLNTYQWPISSSQEVYTETAEAVDNGAVVSQNSWGWGISSYSDMGEYGSYAQAYDEIISGERDHRPISVVFSAGNEGNDGWQSRYDTITGAGATAKNSITAGAVTDEGQMTSFSSWGPTDDGRIKPDLMANGYGVTSTMPGDSYGQKSGTSISAPAVSGAVVLVNQAFEQENGELPTPETVKAALIQTADDLNTEGPDYETGWGLVNVDSAVDLIKGGGQIERGTISSEGDSNTYTFDASEGGKFTLVWSDHPGETSASRTLVNDLDLVVEDSNGNRHHPYTLDPSNPSSAATTDSSDRRNPVEQVRVPEGTGEVTVTVEAANLPASAQDYTLVTGTSGSDGGNDTPSDPDPSPLELEIESPESKNYSTSPVMQVNTSEEANVYWRPNDGYWYEMNQQSETQYQATYDFEEGENTVTFYAEANGETTQKSVTFELESENSTEPANITVKSPESKTYNTEGVVFSIESDKELNRAWYELDSGQSGAITGSGTSFQKNVQLDDGNYTATIYGEDTAGNVVSEEVSFEVDTSNDSDDSPDDSPGDNPDPEPPEITVESPENKVYKTEGVYFSISSDRELESARYFMDGQSGMLTESGGSYTDMVKLEDGQHTVEFKVEDQDGNTNTETVEFEVDTSNDSDDSPGDDPDDGPDDGNNDTQVDFEVVSPEQKTYKSSGVQFAVEADEELEKAEYAVHRQRGMLTESGGSYTDMVKLEDGDYTATITVEDTEGNVETEEVEFEIDTGDRDNNRGGNGRGRYSSSGTVTISVGESKPIEGPDTENETENNTETLSTETKEDASSQTSSVDAVNPEVDSCRTFETRSEVPEDWTVIEAGCNDKEAQMEEDRETDNQITAAAISLDSLKNQLLETLHAIKGLFTFRG